MERRFVAILLERPFERGAGSGEVAGVEGSVSAASRKVIAGATIAGRGSISTSDRLERRNS